MRSARLERQAGFTLVEMLVAMAIFGVMAIVGYRVLDTVLVTRERVLQEYRQWRDVARAVAWLERDLEAIQARPVRDPSDRLLAPLDGAEASPQPDGSALAWTRGGSLEAGGFASPPRRIGYRVREGMLERLTWPGLDRAKHGEPSATILLHGVVKLSVRYFDAGGTWQAKWPAGRGNDAPGTSAHVARLGEVDTTLPIGVDLTIQLASGGRIRRLVPLHSGPRS
jgi:general secretion pathway protein J